MIRAGACLALLLVLAALVGPAAATTVLVMSLEQDRAQLLLNGTVVRQLRSGQSAPEGVRLVRADRNQAVIEIGGRTLALGLGQSTVATAELKADARGHFATVAYINGVETAALIDTGATAVAISSDEAARMGVQYGGQPRLQIATAGGIKIGYRVSLATVQVGGITLNNVDGVVMEGGRGPLPVTLIGMSFLNGVDMRRAGDTMTLTRRSF